MKIRKLPDGLHAAAVHGAKHWAGAASLFGFAYLAGAPISRWEFFWLTATAFTSATAAAWLVGRRRRAVQPAGSYVPPFNLREVDMTPDVIVPAGFLDDLGRAPLRRACDVSIRDEDIHAWMDGGKP